MNSSNLMDSTQEKKAREFNLSKKLKESSIILYFVTKYVFPIIWQTWQMKKQFVTTSVIKACTQPFFTVKGDLLRKIISTDDFTVLLFQSEMIFLIELNLIKRLCDIKK